MTEGILLFPTPPFLLRCSAEELSKHSGRYSLHLSFNRQNIFTLLCFQLYAREGQPELLQLKLREADGKGQDFLQSCKLSLQTLGQTMSRELAADHPVPPALPHQPHLTKQSWLFSLPSPATTEDTGRESQCLQPIHLLLHALLAS